VAAVLGISVTALHSRLYRARVALLAKLKELR
jgi:DNA-directed RNA polymerase specialized sigma24 family protein